MRKAVLITMVILSMVMGVQQAKAEGLWMKFKRAFLEIPEDQKWEYRAGQMLDRCMIANCYTRAEKLSQEMHKAGVGHYLCRGRYKGNNHAWIEDMKGKILDPSQTITAREFYTSFEGTQEIKSPKERQYIDPKKPWGWGNV